MLVGGGGGGHGRWKKWGRGWQLHSVSCSMAAAEFWAPLLNKSVNHLLPWGKKTIKSGKYDTDYVFSSEHCSRKWFSAITKLRQMNAARKNYSLTPKNAALKPSEKFISSDACSLCCISLKFSIDFGGKRECISGWKICLGSLKAWLKNFDKISLAHLLKLFLQDIFCKRQAINFKI